MERKEKVPLRSNWGGTLDLWAHAGILSQGADASAYTIRVKRSALMVWVPTKTGLPSWS